MDDPLKELADANAALYQQFIDENLAADRALIGGGFSKFLKVQAQTAREAIGIDGDDKQPDDGTTAPESSGGDPAAG